MANNDAQAQCRIDKATPQKVCKQPSRSPAWRLIVWTAKLGSAGSATSRFVSAETNDACVPQPAFQKLCEEKQKIISPDRQGIVLNYQLWWQACRLHLGELIFSQPARLPLQSSVKIRVIRDQKNSVAAIFFVTPRKIFGRNR